MLLVAVLTAVARSPRVLTTYTNPSKEGNNAQARKDKSMVTGSSSGAAKYFSHKILA